MLTIKTINKTNSKLFISFMIINTIQDINNNFENQEQLKISLFNKIKDNNDKKQQSSITSTLSALIKSAEKLFSNAKLLTHLTSMKAFPNIRLPNTQIKQLPGKFV
ncbi:unnamed protein product, partial [Rotaria sp. Silwood2]